MAFFKPRQDAPAASQPESADTLRRRAKHRLMGAVLLVLAGVVGFPLLFDSQPRPVPVDIQIEMPDKAKVAPLQIPQAQEAPAPLAKVSQSQVSTVASLDDKEQIIVDERPRQTAVRPEVEAKPEAKAPAKPESAPEARHKPDPKPEPKIAAKPEAKPEPKVPAKAETKTEAKVEPKADDGARAKALLEGKPAAKDTGKDAAKPAAGDHAAASEGRFVVQVGAFAEADKAHEVRIKLEHAGLKTYTHVAETKEGKRIRVRLGPYATRAEADKAAAKVKQLQLPVAILTL